MNSQTVTVNLIPGLSTPAVVRVSQYDIGRPLAFKVLDGTNVASLGATVTTTIVGTKPSGLGFSVVGTLDGYIVTLDTTLAMTQECGMIPAEIRFTTSSPATVIGTANFILAVEPSPHPDGTTDGTYETMGDLQSQLNALDTRVTALEAGGGGSGLTDDIKTALLNCFAHVAWVDANGQDYYDALESALDSGNLSVSLTLSQVSSSNTATSVGYGESYTTTLTASTGYTLNTVSVTMGGVDITSTSYSSGTVSIPSVTGNIVITATAVLAAQSITATYTQSGTVYDTDSLDSLKADLVVTANYAGGTSETVPASNYTLSGTLTAGTSTITVTYAGLTTTFSVTVSTASYVQTDLVGYWDGINNTGSGHNSSATTWKDLVGSNDMTIATGKTPVWTENSYSFVIASGTTSGDWLVNENTLYYTGQTIEAVYIPRAATTTPLLGFNNVKRKVCLYSDNSVSGIGTAANTYGTGLDAMTDMKTISITYSGDNIVSIRVNNSEITQDGASHSFKDNYGFTWGANNPSTGNYGANGVLHAVRVYSRALTDAERTHNYNLDVSRFNLS